MRLTKGYLSGNYATIEQDCDCEKSIELGFYKAINKLGQLEDIEEELGIDLITLFKASFAEALYFKSNKTNRIEYKPFTAMSIKHKTIFFAFDSTIIEFKDYGKTWALTKDELR